MTQRLEQRQCPAEFQDRLTRIFGTNQYGDPIFKIVWGQSQFIRMGNLWRDKRGNEWTGYRERPQCHNQPCWVIMRWHAPMEYGPPLLYYFQTFDNMTKLQMTGEYPWTGRYEIVQPLISKEFVDGKLVVTHFPLNHFLIDRLIPMMEAFRRLSREKQEEAKRIATEAEERKKTEHIADLLEDGLPAYFGPVSYSHQGVRTSLLDRKMEAIQKVWDRMSKGLLKPVFQRGFAQGNRPKIVN